MFVLVRALTFASVFVALLVATVAVGLRRRWGPALSAVVALLVAVDAVHSFGIAAASRDPLFSQVTRVVGGGVVATLGWILGAVAIGVRPGRGDYLDGR